MKQTVVGFVDRHSRIVGLLASCVVIGLATFIFYLRNRAAFQLPNFYAEDGTIIYNNIVNHDPLTAVTSLFNGYLIIGQYAVGYLAYILDLLTGGGLAGLARWSAFSSCLFLGFTVSLPFILFRRQLGIALSLATVLLGAFVPMLNSDYAVIGTLGNLKFAFLYIAFLLLLYRILHPRFGWRSVIVDLLLFGCVLTDVSVALILPFGLWAYRSLLQEAWRNRRQALARLLADRGLLSLVVLGLLSGLYIVAVYLHGIPKMPGYLDTPYDRVATVPLLERSTLFAWLYPVTALLRDRVVIAALLVLLAAWWVYRRQERWFIVFSLWTIFVGTALFVYNRPGISAIYIGYGNKGGADQFFYAQNLVFIFMSVWLAREWFAARRPLGRGLALAALATYLLWAIPYGTSFGGSKVVYQQMGTIDGNLKQACRIYAHKQTAIIQIYPTPTWQWWIPYNKACH